MVVHRPDEPPSLREFLDVEANQAISVDPVAQTVYIESVAGQPIKDRLTNVQDRCLESEGFVCHGKQDEPILGFEVELLTATINAPNGLVSTKEILAAPALHMYPLKTRIYSLEKVVRGFFGRS